MNLRQTWVFPIPPIPQRRHECLDVNLLVTLRQNISSSLSSTSRRPVKIGLELGFWVTWMFICTPPVLEGRILTLFCPELVLKSQTYNYRLTVKEPPMMRVFWAFGKKPDTDCSAWWLLVTSKNIFVSVTHGDGMRDGIRREWIFLRIGCRSNQRSGDRRRNLTFTGGLINDELVISDGLGWTNDWNAYSSTIIHRQCGNRSRDTEVVTGSLGD